jgi:hypothetical protein
LGGGGGAFAVAPAIEEMNAIQRRLEVTQLVPFGTSNPNSPHGFTVRAAETAGGTQGNWYVSVRAVCAAEPVDGHEIVPVRSEPPLSSPTRTAEAPCPGDKVTLGSSGAVLFEPGSSPFGVGLAMARRRAGGNSTIVEAHETGEYQFNWRVAAYAVCATRPLGYEVRNESGTTTFADVSCSNGRRILAAGGVADTTLTMTIPLGTIDDAQAAAPWNPAGGFIAAYTICADAPDQ